MGIVSCGTKGTKGISLLGIEESRRVTHARSLFYMSAGDYVEPYLWGILGLLSDDGTPLYVHIMPLHLAASFSFIGILRTEFDSAFTFPGNH